MNDAAKPGFNPWLVAIVTSLATFMEVLDTTITNVSLSHIAGNLGASQDESTWVLTSYLVANGIVLPLSGWLSNVLGRKRFFMICIAGFTLASFACGAATSLGMLIFFRLIQGLAGGGLQPTQQAIIMDAFPPAKRGAAFGITGVTIIVAPILGPTLGGYITDNMDWRWIFYLNIPIGALAFYLVGRMVEDPPHAMAQGLKKIDYGGLGLIALGLGALQIVLDKGQQEDWFGSNFIIGMTAVGVIALAAAAAHLLRQDDPVIDLRLLARPSFGMACLMIFFTGFALYSSSALLPILTQTQFGYDATLAGMVLSPGGVAVVFLMPVAGKLVGYVQARYLIALGMALLAFGMWATSHVTPQTDYMTFTLMRVLQVLGLPFLFIPNSTMAFGDIPKEKSGKASAIFALCRNLGGSFGIALMASYLTRHQQIHQAHLVEHLTPESPVYRAYLDRLAQVIYNHGGSFAQGLLAAPGLAMRELYRQAALLAYKDAFLFMAAIIACLAVLACFMPRNDPHGRKPDAGVAH